jgi:hypothetical protein
MRKPEMASPSAACAARAIARDPTPSVATNLEVLQDENERAQREQDEQHAPQEREHLVVKLG